MKFLCIPLCFLSTLTAFPQEVLMLGNSYARNLMSFVPGITDEENFFQKYEATWIPPDTPNEDRVDARVYWGTRQLLEHIASSGSATAQVHVFQSWARHPDAADSDLGWLPGTAAEKSARHLEHNVLMCRDMLHLEPDAKISPIGEAWALSLATDPSVRLHAGDGSHGSASGYFLAAAVLYQEITGLAAGENLYRGGLPVATAEFLKGVAESFYQDPPLVIVDFQRAGNGNISIHWACRPGTEYFIESSVDLETWTEVSGTRETTTGGASSATTTFSGAGAAGTFFRVARAAGD